MLRLRWGAGSCGVRVCGVKAALALGVLLCAGNAAWAQLALVPPVKHARAERGPPPPVALPQEFAPPQEAYAAFPEEPAAAAAPAAPSACQARLAKIAVFQPLPTLVGPGGCGAVDAGHLDAVISPAQGKGAGPPAG